MLFFYFSLIFILSVITLHFFKHYAVKQDLLDKPNLRSSHLTPMPRGGGVIFVSLWGLAVTLLAQQQIILWRIWLILIPSSLLVAFVSYMEDRYSVNILIRLIAYFIAAVIFTFTINAYYAPIILFYDWHLEWLFCVLIVFSLVWSTNLFNFMDGIDGIAAIEALFVFGVGGFWLYVAGGTMMAELAYLLVAAILGFLYWNWPPAKIFMGDVGSTFLGFLAAAFAVIGYFEYDIPWLLWVIVYGVFFFDASITLLRRLFAGEKIYRSHRLHAYQRLQDGGWAHRKIVYGVISTNVILSALATISFYCPQFVTIAIISAVSLLTIIYWRIEALQPMYQVAN